MLNYFQKPGDMSHIAAFTGISHVHATQDLILNTEYGTDSPYIYALATDLDLL
jgi:hypothetical protein